MDEFFRALATALVIAGALAGCGDADETESAAPPAASATVASAADAVFGTGETDPAGAAFLALCAKASAVPRQDMDTLKAYSADTGPRPTEAAVRSVLSRHASLIADARKGMRTVGRIELDHAQGANLLPPHLAPSRQLSLLLRADVVMRSKDGDAASAAASCAAIGRVARQLASDRAYLSSLVVIAIMQLFAHTCTELGAADGHADLREIAAWLQGDDPFGIAAALETERTFGLDWIAGEIRAGRIGEHESMTSLGSRQLEALEQASRDLDRSVARCREGYDALLELIGGGRRPSKAEVTAFVDRVRDGAYGDLAIVTLPPMSGTLEPASRVMDRLEPFVRRFGE